MKHYRTLWQLIQIRAKQSPNSIFMQNEAGQNLTWLAYQRAAEGAASALAERGIGEGSVVVWQLPNWMEAVILTAALSRLSVIQVPLLPMLRDASLAFICNQVNAQLLITPRQWKGFDYVAMTERVRSQLPHLSLLTVDSGEGLPESTRPLPPVPNLQTNGKPLRWIFYTSGTTAEPKGALHTDDSLIATGSGMVGVQELAGDDIIPMVFPFTHIGGICWLVSFLLCGCKCLLVEKFSADIIPWMRENGVTVSGAGVAFAQTYLKEQRKQPSSPILPQLRFVSGGGSTKPTPLHREVKQELFCQGFISGYGMTEFPIAVMNSVRDPDDRIALTEGRPLPGVQVRIKDKEGYQLGPGKQGAIWLGGPHVCQGFVDTTLNAEAFDSEGFINSGDLGQLDTEGWLMVTGRTKDIIIRKGENISAKKVEDALYRHPDIVDVAVVALPDPERTERVCAVVELRQPDTVLTLKDLVDFGQEAGLLKRELPEQLEFVTALPRNPSGKVLKEQLKRQYAVNPTLSDY